MLRNLHPRRGEWVVVGVGIWEVGSRRRVHLDLLRGEEGGEEVVSVQEVRRVEEGVEEEVGYRGIIRGEEGAVDYRQEGVELLGGGGR